MFAIPLSRSLLETLSTALYLALLAGLVAADVQVLSNTTLGPDPQTVNRLNGESFQQDPLVTFDGYQYAVFWIADNTNSSIRHPSVSRRALSNDSSSPGEWDTFTFMDYNQTDDDGHDVMVIGVSPMDGTIHLSFDQHDNDLIYRVSQPGVASDPASSNTTWSADLFGTILDYLPGLESLNASEYFVNVTYPRFIYSSPDPTNSSFLLELRVGRSGLGDDWLYEWNATTHEWAMVGKYLEGVNNNAYINGFDFDESGHIMTTWTYRDYVNDTGQDVAVEAGPNGPENNHDLMFAHSPDLGHTWFNTWGQPVGNLSTSLSLDDQTPIVPTSPGITVFSIPKYGGILNQEAQVIDDEGRIHVLNRENGTGYEQWYHYWRTSSNHFWTRTAFPQPSALDPLSINNITGTPTVSGKRGKLVALPAIGGSSSSSNNTSYDSLWSSSAVSTRNSMTLLALLPSNAANSTAFSILASTAAAEFEDWQVVWEIESGCDAEVLFDRYRLAQSGSQVLSLYLVDGGAESMVRVVDLDVSGV